MDFDVVFIVGPQGSGKGTQGKLLAEKLGFFFWDMGAILREVRKENTPLGKQVSAMDQGVLLTDETILEVAKGKLAAIPLDPGVIFDGIPRRLGQAEFLLDYLKAHRKKKMVTLFIDLPREGSLKRLLLRAEKEGRADDTPEAIDARLRQYEDAIKPTLEYLKKETTFKSIDGRPSIPEVEKSVDAALGLS